MLNDRTDEAVATLDGDWLYWFELRGRSGGAMTGSHAIDRDHLAFSAQCKVPGHVTAEPQLLLLPGPIRDAILAWVEERAGP